MSNRIHTLLEQLKKNNTESILLTSKANVYYLSNYYTEPHERVIAVYVSQYHDPLLIIPAMEVEDAKAAGWEHEIIGYHDHENVWELFLAFIKKHHKTPETIGLEFDHLTLNHFQELKNTLPSILFSDASEIVANLRVIKNKKEYTLLKQAANLADFGVETGIKALREGVSELEVIATIEYELKKQGIQEMSFSTMVLSGLKTASPHGNPDMKEIEKGDLVLFDLGVIFEGYCSDTTRTVAFHSITNQQRSIYNTVLEAEQKAIEKSKLDIPLGEIDNAARKHIKKAGYGDYFNHRIGHGIGIETHEYPSMHSNNKLPLQAGMSYTIEPGIYIPDKGGVRIEDMVYMTNKGPEILTQSPKELQIIK
ncbi:M24 family metallopeptidase [Virgibacillus alimentarius]|uniref:Xaa-Pro dipeptidase n=1 Tax=Virgibacillus alimentarius TaxID=698769 RepID=A0ABS4SCE9_9BACI|nr:MULTISPECIES: Xaa-Pro peptidase family protein [Virgibacillus]MBP2259182.1 Xaa-Pro dipeptidase [Virgibacillus alimentarius]HLR68459.1 Xaa-Pro peptidase family protein [Virgibacillus sp.]